MGGVTRLRSLRELRRVQVRRSAEREGGSDTHHRPTRTSDGFRKSSTHPTEAALGAINYDNSVLLGCVKTCAREEGAELFSLLSAPNSGP